MHVLVLLVGLLFSPAIFASTTLEPIELSRLSQDEVFDSMTMPEEDDDVDHSLPPTAAPPPPPISVYRRWLYQLLGIVIPTEAPPESEFEEAFSQFDEWVLINKISREDPVFTDMWDPLASGDWSALAISRLEPAELPTVSSEEEVFKPDFVAHVLTNPEGLFRWAFTTAPQDELDREIERMSVWTRIIESSYNSSLPSFLDSVVSPIDDAIVDAIYLDIDRTRPEDLRPRMARLLMAYAYRNPSVGFCQGMTYLVSALLQQTWMTDEDAFMALSVLIENVNTNYYDDSLSGIRADLRRLEILLIQKLPWIPPIPLALVLVEPLMCLFTRIVAIETSSRILDIAFSQNRLGLFSLYLALLDLTSPAIQRTQGHISHEEAMTSVNAAVTFREELVRIGSNRTELNHLLQRAETYFHSHGAGIAELLKATELPDDVQWVVSTTSTTTIEPERRSKIFKDANMDQFMQKAGATASRLMASLRTGLVALLDEDDDDD